MRKAPLRGGAKTASSAARQGAGDVVRCERELVRLGPGCEAAKAREASEMGQIRLDDVHEAFLDQRAEVRKEVDALAGRDRSPRRSAHAREPGRAVERDRLLQP